MPTRTLPTSDTQHLDALRDAHFQLHALPKGSDPVLSTKTATSLERLYPVWRDELKGRRNVVGLQTEATAAVQENKARLRMFLSHFLQNLNMAIEREDPGFRAGDRTLYGMDSNQAVLPRMEGETELLRVAEDVIEGEAKRIAAGGDPITMPPVAEISAIYGETLKLLKVQYQQVNVYGKESDDVIALRSEVSELVKDIWDELEFSYRKETPSSMRRRCRLWGVIYTPGSGEVEEAAETTSSAATTVSRGNGSSEAASSKSVPTRVNESETLSA
jgi:hypothetical protein